MYRSLTNELGARKESEMGWILLSGDENMCIVDTDSKIEEHCIFPTHLGVELEISLYVKIGMGNLFP